MICALHDPLFSCSAFQANPLGADASHQGASLSIKNLSEILLSEAANFLRLGHRSQAPIYLEASSIKTIDQEVPVAKYAVQHVAVLATDQETL